jgi:hypothetical protein
MANPIRVKVELDGTAAYDAWSGDDVTIKATVRHTIKALAVAIVAPGNDVVKIEVMAKSAWKRKRRPALAVMVAGGPRESVPMRETALVPFRWIVEWNVSIAVASNNQAPTHCNASRSALVSVKDASDMMTSFGTLAVILVQSDCSTASWNQLEGTNETILRASVCSTEAVNARKHESIEPTSSQPTHARF